MTHKTRRPSARGFTLLETMIAIAVLAVGILGLAAMLGDSMAYMQASEYDFIAQQKAEEAAEAIFTAKYNNPNNWPAISNVTGANPQGLFLGGCAAPLTTQSDWIGRFRRCWCPARSDHSSRARTESWARPTSCECHSVTSPGRSRSRITPPMRICEE